MHDGVDLPDQFPVVPVLQPESWRREIAGVRAGIGPEATCASGHSSSCGTGE